MEKIGTADLERSFGELVDRLAQIFEETGVRWMLVGGIAVGAHANPRATKDLDIAVRLQPPTTDLRARLTDIGLEVFHNTIEQVVDGGVVRLRSGGSPPAVIDLLCAGTEFEDEALARRIEQRVLGRRVWLADIDSLLIYKLIAARPQDLADVDALIRVAGGPRDRAFFDRWLDAWSLRDRWRSALSQSDR